ncbi:hypothetical protein [Thauera sinica]|uniref:Uncharacterized protein n=1 Tax=Thauera sinica TaxID=2665146 RepID=A0ABW1AKM1_9RHOO|nr:hypothetical protein [Thauera sp. K11]
MHHDIVLRAPRGLADDGAPAILQRSDEDFVEAVLAALRDADGRAALRADLAKEAAVAAGTDTGRRARKDARSAIRSLLGLDGRREAAGGGTPAPAAAGGSVAELAEKIRDSAGRSRVLKLFQPIQRQFHLAVIEAHCLAPGNPRLDPDKVEGAGLVIRRLRRDAGGGEVKQGWMRAGEQLRGWARVEADAADTRYDPEAARRLARPATGQPVLDRTVAALLGEAEEALLSEHVVPMFVAPPDVCRAAGRTFFYGLVPTTSSERAGGGAPAFDAAGFGPESADFRAHLAGPLRGLADGFPRAGAVLTPGLATIAQPASAGDGDHSSMKRLLLLLRQLAIEFDAFGGDADGEALVAVLNRIGLPLLGDDGLPSGLTTPAGDFLAVASRVLLDGEAVANPPAMPLGWPALDRDTTAALASALSVTLMNRFEAVAGTAGRYDDPDARYVLRAFVRLKPDGRCPARTVWSAYSPAFVIAPWYEGGGAPPVQVALPDPTDKDMLKKLKPNVAFTVPPSLHDLLAGDPQDLLDGKKPAGSGLALGWICSFNIPIITICAFIVLNIFLSLFDLFFRWMMFIKICIPFPKKGGGEE